MGLQQVLISSRRNFWYILTTRNLSGWAYRSSAYTTSSPLLSTNFPDHSDPCLGKVWRTAASLLLPITVEQNPTAWGPPVWEAEVELPCTSSALDCHPCHPDEQWGWWLKSWEGWEADLGKSKAWGASKASAYQHLNHGPDIQLGSSHR